MITYMYYKINIACNGGGGCGSEREKQSIESSKRTTSIVKAWNKDTDKGYGDSKGELGLNDLQVTDTY